MLLYLARHGQAANPAPEQPSQLTNLGISQTRLTAQALANRSAKIDQIWHSPKRRTIETALIYQAILGISKENYIEKETLSIDGNVDDLYSDILQNQNRNLLLVSHQPTLEELSSLLVTGSDHFPHIAFPTSGIVVFEYYNQWKFLYSLNPSQLK